MMSDATPDPIASVDALDALVPPSKITPLTQSKSDIQGLLQACFHFGMFGVAALFIPYSALSLLSLAFIASFFFCGLHECVHRTAFKRKWLNDGFAHVFGFLSVRPACHYRYYHWQHHKYTGNPQLDSELQAGSLLDVPVDSPVTYLWYLSGVPFWMDAVSSIVRHAVGNCSEIYLANERARRQVRNEARIYLALYCVLAAVGVAKTAARSALLQHWILPTLLGQPFTRFYLLAEHRGRKESPIILENTRTITNTNPLYRKLAWNMPYHVEHHAWPGVPFWKLRDAHELVVEAGGDTLLDSGELHPELSASSGRTGYVDFNWRFWKMLVRSKRGEA